MITTERLISNQLLVRVELAAERLASLQEALQSLTSSKRGPLEKRRQEIHNRCEALGGHIMGWPQTRPGTASAVEDLGTAVEALEADVNSAREPQA